MAVANGSSCGSGALSGAVTASAGPLINGQSYGAALVENAVLGGAASVAGGGKFANGAITGAFGYLFNNQAGRTAGGIIGAIIGGIVTGPEDVALEVAGHVAGSAFGDWLTGPDIPAGLADLTNFRSELGLASGQGTLARLDVGDQSFYGINAHGQSIDLTVNPISMTHAEADAFQQAANAGISGDSATLYVDRPLCIPCGEKGAVASMARQIGITNLTVVTP